MPGSPARSSEVEALQKENARLRQAHAEALQRITELREEVEALRRQGHHTEEELKARERLKSPWKADIAVGGNFNAGNTEGYLVNVRGHAVRTWEKERLSLGLSADLGENDDNRTAEKASGQANFRRDFAPRWFWSVTALGETDRLADVEVRATLSPGIGYKIFDQEDLQLSLEAGPAYIAEKLRDEPWEHQLGARVFQEFAWQVNERFKLFQNAEWLTDVGDPEQWLLMGEAGVENKINASLALRLTARNRYANQPAEGRKKNDFSLIGSVVYSFD